MPEIDRNVTKCWRNWIFFWICGGSKYYSSFIVCLAWERTKADVMFLSVLNSNGSYYAKKKKKQRRAKVTNCSWRVRVVTYVAGLVAIAFDSVVAQIINSWRAFRLHCLPPSFFSLHLCFLLSPAPTPPPHPRFVSACPMNQSGWQCAAVREPVRVITHVELGQDLDGPSWQQERRDSGRFYRRNSCPALCLYFFFWFVLFSVERRDWRQTERGRWDEKGPRPDADIAHLLSRWWSNVCPIFLSQKRAHVYRLWAGYDVLVCVSHAS